MLKVTTTMLGPYELNEFGELIIGNMIKSMSVLSLKLYHLFNMFFWVWPFVIPLCQNMACMTSFIQLQWHP